MPSYKKYLIATSLAFLLTGCSQSVSTLDVQKEPVKKTFKKVESKEFLYENAYIIYALEYENQKKYNYARQLYYKLFTSTNKYEYLVKFLTLSFQLRDYKQIDKVVNAQKDFKDIKEEEEILRLHTFSLIRLKNLDEALKASKRLVEVNPVDLNYELLGTIYLEKKEYEKSYSQFETAYSLNNSSVTMLSLTNIEFFYLKRESSAINKLEDFIDENGYAYNVAFQLLSFYEKRQMNEKMYSLLKQMYKTYENNPKRLSALYKTKNLLVRYLAKNDTKEAVRFLEEKDPDNAFLVSLYRTNKEYDKLYTLLEKLYSKTKNVDFLAQMAIVEFETAEDKTTVLNSVISKFEKALVKLDNPVYQNYLAYLLIDYDIDSKKGIELVKKALKKEPDNLAYIDTLAWGEYKLNNCQEAYKQMKIVVDKAGLEDKEIKLHWEKIKECIK